MSKKPIREDNIKKRRAEGGKGFVVVAMEVEVLAKQTGDATKNISSVIHLNRRRTEHRYQRNISDMLPKASRQQKTYQLDFKITRERDKEKSKVFLYRFPPSSICTARPSPLKV